MRELMCAIFGAVLAFSICTIFRSDHPSTEKKVAPQPSFESWKEKVNKKQEKKSCIVAPRAPLYKLVNGSLIEEGMTVNVWIKAAIIKKIPTSKENYLMVQTTMEGYDATIFVVREVYVIYPD